MNMFFKLCPYLIVFGFCFNNAAGQHISVTGKAMNVKGNAVVVTVKKGMYYVNGLDYWNKKFYGKRVKVTGELTIENNKPEAEKAVIKQEMIGIKRIIENCKWGFG